MTAAEHYPEGHPLHCSLCQKRWVEKGGAWPEEPPATPSPRTPEDGGNG